MAAPDDCALIDYTKRRVGSVARRWPGGCTRIGRCARCGRNGEMLRPRLDAGPRAGQVSVLAIHVERHGLRDWDCCLYWESPPTVTCSWCGAHISGPLPNPNRADNPVRHGCCGACYQGLLAELEQDCETGAAGRAARPE